MAANIAPLPLSSLYSPSAMTAAISTSGTYYFKHPSPELVMPEAGFTVTSDIDLNNGLFEDQMLHHIDSSVSATFNIQQNYPQVDNNSFVMMPGGTTNGTCTSSGGSNSNINNNNIFNTDDHNNLWIPEYFTSNGGSSISTAVTIRDHKDDHNHHQASMDNYYYDSIEELKQLISSTSSTSSNLNIDTCLFDESKTIRQEDRVIYF